MFSERMYFMKKLLFISILLSSLSSFAQVGKDEAYIIQEQVNSQITLKFMNKVADLKTRKNLSKEMAEFVDLAITAQQIQYSKWEGCQNKLDALSSDEIDSKDSKVQNKGNKVNANSAAGPKTGSDSSTVNH